MIETHTIEGERMLRARRRRCSAEVGRIVRSCHERWDGDGYPDGLAGEEIPLVGADRRLLRRLQRDDDRTAATARLCTDAEPRSPSSKRCAGGAVRPGRSPPRSRG